MVLPCSSQLHSLLTSQSCTEGVTGGIQPSSPQPLSGGELNMQTRILSVAWQKHSLKQGRCPQKKAKEKKKVLPLEKQLDIASWRGGKMFQPPSLQSCFCSLEYAFQGGAPLFPPLLSTDRSAGFSCPLQLKTRGIPLFTSSSQDAGGARGSMAVELAIWSKPCVSLHLIDFVPFQSQLKLDLLSLLPCL